MPLATDVVSGARADDGLYLPIIERIRTGLLTTGLLFVGDCKMSALDTRAYLARHQDCYLAPLPLTGATGEATETWITTGVRQGEAGELARIWRTNERGHEVLAAEGYEFERTCGAPDSDVAWRERVLVVRSPLHATQQAAGLEKRLQRGDSPTALTPPRGRGKRQITDEATLVEAIDRVLQDQRVDGLLSVAWEKQVEQTTQYVWVEVEALCTARSGWSRNPLPHHSHHSPERHHCQSLPTFRLEGVCHQCGAKAAVFAGGGVVLSQRIPRNASSTASRAGSISRRCLSNSTSKLRASRTC